MAIQIYVFDAYGTLFDVHAAVRLHATVVGAKAEDISALWRGKQLEYSWIRSLMGRYVDFWQCTRDALEYALRAHDRYDEGLVNQLLDAYRNLEAYPDARSTLMALRERGYKTAILSNGSPQMLSAAVASAGLADCLDEVLSVDTLQKYKPDPAVYGLVTKEFRLSPHEVSFQSSNNWDLAGACSFGFRCVRINRTGLPDEYCDVSRTRSIPTLEGLLSLN
jgi:2-haloacid dehalogenase